jgi:hypothetical protein
MIEQITGVFPWFRALADTVLSSKKPFAHKNDLYYYETDYRLPGSHRHVLPCILLNIPETPDALYKATRLRNST